MHIALTEKQESLRLELREYFEGLMTAELEAELSRSEGGGPLAHQAVKQMAADGWIGVGWPLEYGGRGFTPMEQFIFFDEVQRAGAPLSFLTTNAIGPAIQTFGTQQQKDAYLPRILAGDCVFAIGYTEPEAGTDLASLKTKGLVEGDEIIINGQKIFTSLTDHADYIWLACRTDPDSSKHRGISIVIVPTDSEGFSYTPIKTVGDANTFATYYQDVRVPLSNVVGDLHEGWRVIVTQLNFERVALCAPGLLQRHYEGVSHWARETMLTDGRRVVDQEWVQIHLARVRARLDALKLINFKVAWQVSNGVVDVAESSATKVFGTEQAYCDSYGLLLEIIGSAGLLQRGTEGAVLKGRLERAYRGSLILTFGGGTNEIQRDLIAAFGLKMPRSLR